jgi:hypothetical protein
MGIKLALAGVVLPGVAIMSCTLVAAIWIRLQGMILTAELLAFFIAVMMLMPKAWPAWTVDLNAGPKPAEVTAPPAEPTES